MSSTATIGGGATDGALIRGIRLLAWVILGLAVIAAGTGSLAMRGKRWSFDLPLGTVIPDGGNAYRVELPKSLTEGLLEAPADSPRGELSDLVVLENGRYLGPAHSTEEEVRQKGAGALSHRLGAI